MTLAYNLSLAAEKAAKKAREEGISIGLSQGISQGEHKKAVETAKNALTMHLPIEQIAILTGLSIEEIEKL